MLELNLSEAKRRVIQQMDSIASNREKWIKRNRYYYDNSINFLKYNIPEGSRILEIGCGTGYLLSQLKSSYGVGIDISSEMIKVAQSQHTGLKFINADAENLNLEQKFDFVIISDTIGYFEDIQKVFLELQKVVTSDTRIIITYINFSWLPLLNIGERIGLKMPSSRLNWLNEKDISNLLQLSDYDIIKTGKRFLFPFYFPILAWFFNKYIANLPLFNSLCLNQFIIARSTIKNQPHNEALSVSVIIPARNEKGNIENALMRMPKFGKHLEVIFIEGNSTDDTLDEIKRVCEKYALTMDVKYGVQEGKGKGDAVRKGFAIATGDVLMILDADLTVRPEDLPKFYDALASGKGEYINGTRLVYPMEDQAMRTLNMIGNHFFSLMFSWLIGQRLKDTLCGTKVMTKKNYERLIANRSYFGDFDPFGDFDLIFGSSKLNLKIMEVPIRYKAREYGETNISRFKHGWLLLKMTFFAMGKIKFIH
jgi:ubiquinone/menaquinone biosynthesis C-methylase UbiE